MLKIQYCEVLWIWLFDKINFKVGKIFPLFSIKIIIVQINLLKFPVKKANFCKKLSNELVIILICLKVQVIAKMAGNRIKKVD